MDKTSIKVEFDIYGNEFNPSEITEKLKTQPNITYLKGDVVKSEKNVRKETSWSLETKYIETLDINDVLDQIMVSISDKADILKQIRKTYNVKILFMIVIRIENNEIPAIYFNKKFVEFAGYIGAEIGFDTFIF